MSSHFKSMRTQGRLWWDVRRLENPTYNSRIYESNINRSILPRAIVQSENSLALHRLCTNTDAPPFALCISVMEWNVYLLGGCFRKLANAVCSFLRLFVRIARRAPPLKILCARISQYLWTLEQSISYSVLKLVSPTEWKMQQSTKMLPSSILGLLLSA